jgi:tetratricopeptide (TPR) repeat protein
VPGGLALCYSEIVARFSSSPAPLVDAPLEALEPELVTDEGPQALALRPRDVPRMQLARSLEEAGPRTFVYVDGKGRVRSPARYRAVQAAGYAALGTVVLGGTALYTSLFGPPGALVGLLFGAAAGRSLLLTREINHAALLSSHDRLDEAELILRRLLRRRLVARRLRALAHHNLGAVATRRGDHAEALEQLRRAVVLYQAAWRKSPHLRSCQYGEVIALCNLGQADEARQRLRGLAEAPEGDYLLIKHWTTQLYVDFCRGAFDRGAYGEGLWDRAQRALRITSSSALLGLCAWGFEQLGEHDMAWHVLREAFDRLEGVPLLRTMPPLWRWMEAHKATALAAQGTGDHG